MFNVVGNGSYIGADGKRHKQITREERDRFLVEAYQREQKELHDFRVGKYHYYVAKLKELKQLKKAGETQWDGMGIDECIRIYRDCVKTWKEYL